MILLSILTAKYTAAGSSLPQSQVEVQQPAPLSPTTAPDVAPFTPLAAPAEATPEESPTE